MVFRSSCREQEEVSLAVDGNTVCPELAVEVADLSDDLEFGVEDCKISAAADAVDVVLVGYDAGRLSEVALAVSKNVTLVVEDMDCILVSVADPDLILGVDCYGMDHEELAGLVSASAPGLGCWK